MDLLIVFLWFDDRDRIFGLLSQGVRQGMDSLSHFVTQVLCRTLWFDDYVLSRCEIK